MTTFGAIITLHREGGLAHKTLNSIELCRRYAEEYGIDVTFYISLDRANEETNRVVQFHPAIRETDHIYEVDHGDLGLCRNFLISKANTEFIGTFDGDDYWSRNWIAAGTDKARNTRIIAHPELIIAFGADSYYFYQRSQNERNCVETCLFSFNLWDACMITRRRLAIETPYEPVNGTGQQVYGYEDWHWNCETIAKGFQHLISPKTILYSRKKYRGSLCNQHDAKQVIIRPSNFFKM